MRISSTEIFNLNSHTKKKSSLSKKKQTLSEILEIRRLSQPKNVNNIIKISKNIFPDSSFIDDTDEDTPKNSFRSNIKGKSHNKNEIPNKNLESENRVIKENNKNSMMRTIGKLLFNFSPKTQIEELKQKIYESERKEYKIYKERLNSESKKINYDSNKIENKKIIDLRLLHQRKSRNKFITFQKKNKCPQYNFSMRSPEEKKVTLEVKRKFIEKRREKEKEEKEKKFQEDLNKKLEERKIFKEKNKNIPEIRIISHLKKNKSKLTKGTQKLIISQIEAAEESIRTGIYITLCSNNLGNRNECIKIGPKNKCICGHFFDEHEIQIKPSLITKCHSCICNKFNYIPIYPEETDKYLLCYYNVFNYDLWNCECKCGHGYNFHKVDNNYNCDKCNCFIFNSNFKCAVCGKFLEEHKLIYEREIERKVLGYTFGKDYYPFNEKMIKELLE